MWFVVSARPSDRRQAKSACSTGERSTRSVSGPSWWDTAWRVTSAPGPRRCSTLNPRPTSSRDTWITRRTSTWVIRRRLSDSSRSTGRNCQIILTSTSTDLAWWQCEVGGPTYPAEVLHINLIQPNTPTSNPLAHAHHRVFSYIYIYTQSRRTVLLICHINFSRFWISNFTHVHMFYLHIFRGHTSVNLCHSWKLLIYAVVIVSPKTPRM